MKSGGLRRAPTCSSGAIWSVGFGSALLTNYHYQSAISNVRIILHTTKKECLSLKKKKITPHSFRHTAATHMILAKEDLNTVRMMLGHSSLQTTMRYTKLNGEQLRHAIEHCAYLPKTNAIWKSDLSIKERLKSL